MNVCAGCCILRHPWWVSMCWCGWGWGGDAEYLVGKFTSCDELLVARWQYRKRSHSIASLLFNAWDVRSRTSEVAAAVQISSRTHGWLPWRFQGHLTRGWLKLLILRQNDVIYKTESRFKAQSILKIDILFQSYLSYFKKETNANFSYWCAEFVILCLRISSFLFVFQLWFDLKMFIQLKWNH